MNKRISEPINISEHVHLNQISAHLPYNKKRRPLGDLCLEIAEFAKDRDYRTLDFLLRMAAAEAYDQTSETLPSPLPGNNELVGLWDWDVAHNLAYVDPVAADLFDVGRKGANKGLPVQEYMKAMHPEDVTSFNNTVFQVANEGGLFDTTYRVINHGRIVWIHARGSCFRNSGKIPSRFSGALFNVTAAMTG